MKVRHIIINTLPFFGWIIFLFLASIVYDNFFDATCNLLSFDLIIPLFFVVYNLFSKKLLDIILRNTIFAVSYISGYYLSLKKLLPILSHTSDDHLIPNRAAVETFVYITLLTVICVLIKYIVLKPREDTYKETGDGEETGY